jgi:hypothetical protein
LSAIDETFFNAATSAYLMETVPESEGFASYQRNGCDDHFVLMPIRGQASRSSQRYRITVLQPQYWQRSRNHQGHRLMIVIDYSILANGLRETVV